MTTVAILGATGHIAKALAAELAADADVRLVLYARRPDAAAAFAAGLPGRRVAVREIGEFGKERFDVVINAVGGGDPATLAAIGRDIFRITEACDNVILDALERCPEALYLFLSSGAVYGPDFSGPGADGRQFCLDVNALPPSSFYALAKLNAEAKHRAHAHLNIVDLRVFSFFSRYIDTGGRFFMAELARCLQQGKPFVTGRAEMVRDYAVPADFAALVRCCTSRWKSRAAPVNAALDVYSAAPIGKFELLDALAARFGLEVEVTEGSAGMTATGAKQNYFSTRRAAGEWGFTPAFSSLSGVEAELALLLGRSPASAASRS